MSFSQNVKRELIDISTRSACCRRAELYGLLFNAVAAGDNISATYNDPSVAEHTAAYIRSTFSTPPDESHSRRGAHKYITLSFSSKNAAKKIESFSFPQTEGNTAKARIFECEDCKISFIRGAFMACGTLNDPERSAHLEFKFSDSKRTAMLADMLTELGFEPRISQKEENVRIYFKNRSVIQDIITYMGGMHSVFEMMNGQLEKELRNNENRATNCVATNINRAVLASGKQMQAILHLKELDLLDAMPEDLRITAELRLKHTEASLSELASLHEPPITKSGVNHRIEKIMAWYEKNVSSNEK